MPARIKFIFSIAVVLTAIAGYFFQAGLGHVGPSYASLGFGAIAVIAMWLFPEVTKNKSGNSSAER
jgi:hypothetical protein